MLRNVLSGSAVLWVAKWTVVMAACSSRGSSSTQITINAERDARLSTPQLIEAYGYPVETHYVKTEDGYFLSLHRIPKKRRRSAKNNKVVFVQHGMLGSSADWVVMGPGRALAYVLSDAGYDVWLGNARGNSYSKRHERTLTREDYWNFSFHEMGVYDLPAAIDYILQKTGNTQINYVGHSMGTTMFYVMAAERPEYNKKIRLMISLAPIAYLSHINNNFLKWFSQFGNQLGWLLSMVGVNEFQPNPQLREMARAVLCREKSPTQDFCSNTLFLLAGIDAEQIDKKMLPVILGHTPAGTSTKVFIHYSQIVNSGRFQKLDRGLQGNLQYYKHATPPIYNLNNITTPIVMYLGDNDHLTNHLDIDQLHRELRRVVGRYRVPYRNFSHLDFIWANDAKTLVYNDVIRVLDKW